MAKKDVEWRVSFGGGVHIDCAASFFLAEEERELEEAARSMMLCDSTSDSSDEADSDGSDEMTAKDKEFMQMAQSCAMKSEDSQTKVYIIVSL